MDMNSGTGDRNGARRDALTLKALFEQYNPWVLRRLRRFGVRNDADLEEQAMKVWEIVVKRYDEFRGEAQITTWIAEICRRVASDFRQQAWTRRAQPDAGESADVVESGGDPELVLRTIDALALLRTLPPMYRDVLVLYYCEERTAAEIAEILCVEPRKVYTLVEKAIGRLQDELRRRGEGKG